MNYLKYIIAGIGILVVFISGGLFLGKYFYSPRPQVAIQPTVAIPQSATPTIIPTTEPMANWKTYKNSINKYSIDIPPNWTVNDSQGSFLGIPGEIVIGSQSEMKKGIWGTTIAIAEMSSSDRYGLDTQQQFDEWVTRESSSEAEVRIFKTGNIQISGMNAVQFVKRSTQGVDMHPFYLIVTWVRRDGTNYYIELSGNDYEEVSRFTNIYNQILSTFKFLDQNINN